MSKALDIEHARSLVLGRSAPLASESVSLRCALGRTLAADARAIEQVPSFENSAMDGFAVRAADTTAATSDSPVALRIVGESRAGVPSSASVGSGEAVRISTGAMLPDAADAVVRVEDARTSEGRVEVLHAVAPGHDVRRAGEDVERGARVLHRGVTHGPAELGVLASLGCANVACTRLPRVAVLTTGDELLEPDEPYRRGGVRNTNAFTIPSLVERSGAEVVERSTVPDERGATHEAIAAALGNDVLVVCGGVSVGEHDHVRPALAELGIEQVFWRIALRPGGPTWFGAKRDGCLVFGLPGNPVSAMVTFLLLVRPALRALSGAAHDRTRTRAVLDEDYRKPPGRAHAVRCKLELREDGWHARATGAQGSHILTSMLGADALALIGADSEGVNAGESVEIELMAGGCG
ncbi:MAG: molybdopterin molybdotransferase MoeA [Solirubrobacteraceae bacterium]